MSYITYFLRFASQEEAETKLIEAGYSQEVQTREFQKVRARDDDGQFIGDDPGTPENEAWTEVPVTKTVFRVPDGDIDIIGDIYNNDGVYEPGENGFPVEVTPPTKMNGYHLNIIKKGELVEDLQEFVVTPGSPHRVFA